MGNGFPYKGRQKAITPNHGDWTMNEIRALIAKTGATATYDADGYVLTVTWNGQTYGDLLPLLSFVERARTA